MNSVTSLAILVLISWCLCVVCCKKNTRFAEQPPCAAGAVNECAEHAKCVEVDRDADGSLYEYKCKCVKPYTGDGFVKCQSLCELEYEQCHSMKDYSRPGCKEGYYLGTLCSGEYPDDIQCRCVDRVNGSFIPGPIASNKVFNFDDCVDKSIKSGRCKIAAADRLGQLYSFDFLMCHFITGNYLPKQCDLKWRYQCWCVDPIYGQEIPGTRGYPTITCEKTPDRTGFCRLPHIENGWVSSGIIINDTVDDRATISIYCHGGYKLKGPSRRVCRNGRFTKKKRESRCISV